MSPTSHELKLGAAIISSFLGRAEVGMHSGVDQRRIPADAGLLARVELDLGAWGDVAIYAFYPCRPDGTSLRFETAELPSDDAAIARAQALFAEHHTASHVAVWTGDRQVMLCERRAAAAQTP